MSDLRAYGEEDLYAGLGFRVKKGFRVWGCREM